MYCLKCGAPNPMNAAFCGRCGSPLQNSTPVQQTVIIQQQQLPPGLSRDTAGLLAIFLGVFGAHDFYVGRSGEGAIKLILTVLMVGSPIVAVWNFINIIQILLGSYHDKWNRPLEGNATFTKILVLLYIAFLALIVVAIIYLLGVLLAL